MQGGQSSVFTHSITVRWLGWGWGSFSGSVPATSSCLIKYSQEALQNGYMTLPLTQKPEDSRFCPSSSARGITYLSNLIIVLICTFFEFL